MRRAFALVVLVLSTLLFSASSLPLPPPFSSPSSPVAPGPTVHVVLIAGQSNSVGYNVDPFTPEDASDPRILQLSCCSNGKSLPPAQCYLNVSADPLMPCQGAHVSFVMSFARALLPLLPPSDLIVVVPTGISGTGFADNVWTAYTGGGFRSSVAMLRRAWELVSSAPYTTYNRKLEGVLWHQGEHDAGDNGQGNVANTTFYLQNDIGPLIAALRNTSYINFTSPTLPFVAGQMLPSWVDNSTHPVRQGVKLALALLTQYVPYTGFADSYGLLGDPVNRSGLDNEVIHFTARSQRILGRRYMAAWLAALENYPEPTPLQQTDKAEAGQRQAQATWWGGKASSRRGVSKRG